MVFSSEIGLLTEPVPTEYGAAIVEILDRQVQVLDESEQAQRRTQIFQEQLDQIRAEAEIEDLWGMDMVPRQM
jgi:parvulin-like peptidyl-prolyl isomerase